MEYVLVHQSMNDSPKHWVHTFQGVESDGSYNFGGRIVSPTLENTSKNYARGFIGLTLVQFPLKIEGGKIAPWSSTAAWTSRNCDFEEKLEVKPDESNANASMTFNGESLRVVKIVLRGESSSLCYKSSDVVRTCSYSPKYGLCMEETFERYFQGSKKNSWRRHVELVNMPAKTSMK
jgi:hypothetical protein